MSDAPGTYSMQVRFKADVPAGEEIISYAVDLISPANANVAAGRIAYLGSFDFDFPAGVAAGPGAIIDDAVQMNLGGAPQSGSLTLFEFTLKVTIPSGGDIQLYSAIGGPEWATELGEYPMVKFADAEPLVAWADFPDAALEITQGEPKRINSSGATTRAFCPDCGSGLFYWNPQFLPGIVALWTALKQGDEQTVYQLYYPICALVSLQLQAGLDGFLAIEKYVLKRRGLFRTARRRKPYSWEMDDETRLELDRLLGKLDEAVDFAKNPPARRGE